MQPLKKITTIEELRTARKELRLKHKVTKREIVHNFGATTTNAKDLLLKRIALPVGGAAAAVYGISKLTGNSQKADTAYVNGQQVKLQRADNDSGLLVLPALMSIGKLLYNRYKQNRMVDRISHRTARAVLNGDVPPAPEGGDDASNTSTGKAPHNTATTVPTTRRTKATVINSSAYPVG